MALTACATERSKPHETAAGVAEQLRKTWGSTAGSPLFDYSCKKLDDRGQLFTCLVRDGTDTVRVASFDVICETSKCTWTVYPAYIG